MAVDRTTRPRVVAIATSDARPLLGTGATGGQGSSAGIEALKRACAIPIAMRRVRWPRLGCWPLLTTAAPRNSVS